MKMEYKHTRYASYIGYITQAIVNNFMPLLFLIFQRDFGISLEKIGLLISINFSMQIVVDFLAARYVDRLGYRNCIMAAHIFCFMGLVGLGVLPELLPKPFSGILIAIIINAIGGGLIEVLISPIVEALPGNEKEKAMSLLHSFYCWGHVGVVIISTAFFSIFGIQKWKYLSIAWSFVPLFNTWNFMRVPIQMLKKEGEEISIKKLFCVKSLWVFFLLMICAGASEQAISQWASYFAEQGLKISKLTGDLLGPCSFAFCMGISRMLYGIYGEKIKVEKALLYSGFLCVISYIIVVASPISWLALIGCTLCGFSVGILWPGVFSLSSKSYPKGGTVMFALLALAGDIGCSIGPGLVGGVSNYLSVKQQIDGIQYGLTAAIMFPVLFIIGVFFIYRNKLNGSGEHK